MESDAAPKSPSKNVKGASGVALVGVMVIALNVSGYLAFRENLEGHWYFPLVAAAGILPFVPAALFRAHREEGDNRAYSIKSGDLALGFAIAVAVYFVVLGSTRVLAPLGSTGARWMLALYTQWGDPVPLRGRMMAICGMTFVCVYGGELVWRDYARRLLEPELGSRTTRWLVVVLYGAAHIGACVSSARGSDRFNPVLLLGSLALGALWSELRRVTGRIAPGVVAHALAALALVLFFRLYGL